MKFSEVTLRNSVLLCSMFFIPGCFSASEQTKDQIKNIKNYDMTHVSMDKDTYPVVIIGSGPGGLTAAIYSTRANVDCLVIEGSTPGGAVTRSDSVRNWPGQIAISGSDLMDTFFAHVNHHDVPIVAREVTSVDFSVWPYVVNTRSVDNPSKTHTYKALTCIIATGSVSNKLGVKGEEEYWGRGVSHCVACDGALYQDKDVLVVGGGDAAMQEAAYISGIARSVTVLVRSNRLRARDRRRDYVTRQANVKILYNTGIEEILGDDDGVTGVMLHDNETNTTYKKSIDGIFLAIGSRPNSQFFTDYIDLDERGYIVVDKEQQTSLSGVYATGDVADPYFKQVTSAAGDASKAASRAIDFLQDIGYHPSLRFCVEKESNVLCEILDTAQTVQSDVQEKPASPLRQGFNLR